MMCGLEKINLFAVRSNLSIAWALSFCMYYAYSHVHTVTLNFYEKVVFEKVLSHQYRTIYSNMLYNLSKKIQFLFEIIPKLRGNMILISNLVFTKTIRFFIITIYDLVIFHTFYFISEKNRNATSFDDSTWAGFDFQLRMPKIDFFSRFYKNIQKICSNNLIIKFIFTEKYFHFLLKVNDVLHKSQMDT